MKIELTGIAEFEKDEGECARIAEISQDDCDIFVRIHGYNQDGNHPTADKLQGKKVKITIEEIS